MIAPLLQLLHRGENLPDLFVAEQTVLAAVGIEPGNGHGSLCDAQLAQRLRAADDIVDNPLPGHKIARLPQ